LGEARDRVGLKDGGCLEDDEDGPGREDGDALDEDGEGLEDDAGGLRNDGSGLGDGDGWKAGLGS
jgi:hypothetical protein